MRAHLFSWDEDADFTSIETQAHPVGFLHGSWECMTKLEEISGEVHRWMWSVLSYPQNKKKIKEETGHAFEVH